MILLFPGGLRKALTLSYDDGVEQDVRLMAILDRAGIKATFNLNSGCFAAPGTVYPPGQVHRRMTEQQVLSLYGGSGHEVAVHCLTHADLTNLPREGMVREIFTDRMNLERLFGGMVRGAAYPYGACSDEAVEALRACGIRYCRTVESSRDFQIPRDWLRLRPTCHHGDPQLTALCDRFLARNPFRSELFYLWGHAYEFEAEDNWRVIEEFAARMGNREDIWYATNIQVCDYVTAYRALAVTAAGDRVWNPTALPVWLEEKGRTICVAPGTCADL